jgi:hypothetical protein
MTRTRGVRLLLAPVLLVGTIAVALGIAAPATAGPLHGITVLDQCSSTTYTGAPLLCGGETQQNVNSGDTVTITGVSVQINTESGPNTSGNILPDLSLTFAGGASCGNRQTSCTIPFGGSITVTPSDLNAYIVQQGDYSLPGQILSEVATVDWTDSCTGAGAGNCPVGVQTTSASASTTVKWSDWTPLPNADNSTRETLMSVSCASASFCVAIDHSGRAVTYDGSAWSLPTVVYDGYPSYFGAELRQVSCVSSTFCVASDDDGSVFTYNGSSWSLPDPVTSSPFNMGVSCASTTFCVAIALDGGGLGFVYNGSTWTQMTIDTNPSIDGMDSVSCVLGTDFCAALDDAGSVVFTSDGGTSWSPYASVDSNPSPVISVSCATTTYCLAVDNVGDGFTYNGTSWSTQDIAGTNDLTSVSCTTGSSPIICYVVDSEGDFMDDPGGTWNGAVGLDSQGGLDSVSCVAPGTFCAMVDSHSDQIVYTYNGSPHFTGGFIDGGPTSLNAVACPSTTDCGGVDSLGNAGFSNGVTLFNFGTFDPGQSLDTFSCASTSFCLSADINGGYLTYDSGSWTLNNSTDDGVTSVSCAPGTTFCAAVTNAGGADENPDPASSGWPGVATIDSGNSLTSVSCATASFCIATDSKGRVFTFTGVSWSGAHDIDGTTALTSVSCPTISFCAATDNQGDVLITSNGGAVWSSPQLVDSGAVLTSVSCTSATFCAAVDMSGHGLTYNGATWTAPLDVDENNDLTSVSCASDTVCAAVDTSGNAVVYSAPALSFTKTADASPVLVGNSIGFTATLSNSAAVGTGTAAGLTLSDPLPAGTGIDWSISPSYGGPGSCSITGAVGSQTVTCTITTLPAGGSASVHVTSATTEGSGGTYSNTATVSAANAPNVSAMASVTVIAYTPSVSTALTPPNPVSVGTSVSDQATLTGASPTAGGNVAYAVYSNNTCGTLVASLGTKPVTNGMVGPSNGWTATPVGSYWFQATYSGDAGDIGPVSSACASEPMTVNPYTPSVSTVLTPPNPVSVGTSVSDQATLTCASPTAGGNVTYAVYSNNTCGTLVASLGTKPVTNGMVGPSNGWTATPVGSYWFQATYSGDAGDTGPVSSACASEPMDVVAGAAPVITTTSSMIPSATPEVPYSYQLEAAGGTPPYTWTVTGGALPMGLSLSPSGVLSGNAAMDPATYDFTATVVDSGSPPRHASQSLSVVVVPISQPPPPNNSDTSCNGSCSTTVVTSTGSEKVKGTSVGTGVVEMTVLTEALDCAGLDYSPQVTDIVSTTTFPAGLTVTSTINHATDAKAYVTCYSDPMPFLDAAGQTVTTGFLPPCPGTVTGPCVISQITRGRNVVVTIHILDGDPRFWTGKAGKPPKPPKK